MTIVSRGQQFPIYTQYMFNPYLVNPSLLAPIRKSEINLLYRQQWTGIQDGPKTIQADYQHAIDNRMALGVNIYNDETILLSNISTMATFGYKVPLASEHILGFGLSAGFVSSRLKTEDIPDIDANDPAILNNLSNSFSFNGAFGFNYSYRDLVVGVSLIRLFDNNNSSSDSAQNLAFSQLKDRIAFVGYKFHLSENFGLQPNFSYRFTSDDLNFYEASAIFSYKDLVSVGGGYRESFGPTAIVRLNIKDLQIGFAYDFPSTKASVSTGGTNEIQLKWRFGKVLDKPTKKEKTPKISEPVNDEVIVPEQKPVEVDSSQTKNISPIIIAESIPEKKIEKDTVNTITEQPSTNEFILIAGTFNRKANADKLIKELARNGIEAEIIQVEKYYYVHVPKYKTDQVTLEKVLEIRNRELFKDAWYKKVDK
jgi:type IX secretion system PorP/SprF family membrane protein